MGEPEKKKKCDHATSLYSATSGVCRDLFLVLHADDPASGLAHGAGPGCAPSGNSSYEDTACEARSVRGLGMKNRKQFDAAQFLAPCCMRAMQQFVQQR